LRNRAATFLKNDGGGYDLADHFLSRFADAYLAEMKDFVNNMLHDHAPRVTGEDGLRAVEIAVAAQKSSLDSVPCPVRKSA
jgi:predicted dehydrogenase